jgi:hypothetical protein
MATNPQSTSASCTRTRVIGATKRHLASHNWIVNKLPKTKDEIQRLIMAELRTFTDCEKAWGVVVIPITADDDAANWTVSCFNHGESDAYACDLALQHIVPHYQRLYELAQKH